MLIKSSMTDSRIQNTLFIEEMDPYSNMRLDSYIVGHSNAKPAPFVTKLALFEVISSKETNCPHVCMLIQVILMIFFEASTIRKDRNAVKRNQAMGDRLCPCFHSVSFLKSYATLNKLMHFMYDQIAP